MSTFYHLSQLPTTTTQLSSYPAITRRGRLSRPTPNLTTPQKSFRSSVRTIQDVPESPAIAVFRTYHESIRGFELVDDVVFCPNLLPEDDTAPNLIKSGTGQDSSVYSYSSDGSSHPSNSINGSPMQAAKHVLPSTSRRPPLGPPSLSAESSLKLHQPSAMRGRNAIPIVHPITGVTVASPMASPCSSVSPGRMTPRVTRKL